MLLQEEQKKLSISEQIESLAELVSKEVGDAVHNIENMDETTRIVALNAKIEAARAGDVGKAFAVVANEIERLSKETAEIAISMKNETQRPITELLDISRHLKTSVVGTRLADLALTNIELVDRNLYERSCDVRWWATDDSLTKALADQTSDALNYASKRLGIILNSYTVYYDLVLCDLNGTVVANGRPKQYHSVGMNQQNEPWFQEAMATRSGEEYGFQSAHASALVAHQHALIYSCCVRENGDVHGRPVGALGIIFNWTELSQNIVKNTPIEPEEWAHTRVCLFDANGLILADTQGQELRGHLALPEKAWKAIQGQPRGYHIDVVDGEETLIAYAYSPGYETYATGWYSAIIQTL